MAELVVEILDYWHSGSSRGSGVGAAAACLTDKKGLPYLPGRHLKGLLRDAVRRCPLVTEHAPGWEPQKIVQRLFGSQGFKTVPGVEGTQVIEQTKQGALAFSDARLPRALRQRLGGRDRTLVPHLFAGLAQTAVAHDRGAAKAGSLRRTEVAVPLTLTATIEWEEAGGAAPDLPWQAILSDALPLVMAVGRQRSRGLGRCRMRLEGN